VKARYAGPPTLLANTEPTAAAGEFLNRVFRTYWPRRGCPHCQRRVIWSGQSGAGEDRTHSVRSEFHNRVVARVGHVEIARSVKGEPVRVVQSRTGKERRDTVAV
jgi:hypothetical protein